MKSYREFIRESRSSSESIESICQKYGITNYTINSDESIDVDGDVYLYNEDLTKLPLKFRNVSGNFACIGNKLTTLEGCPQIVGEYFLCNDNKLTTLIGGPQSVGGYFGCSNNQLTTLEGGPQSVGEYFLCNFNKLINFHGFPEDFEGDIHLFGNPVEEIYKLFDDVKCIKWLNEFDVIQGNDIILDRLEEVYHQLGMEIPENIKFRNYKII